MYGTKQHKREGSLECIGVTALLLGIDEVHGAGLKVPASYKN